MKKILLYIPIVMLAFWSCNQMEDVYNDLDGNPDVVAPYHENIEYTLLAADYTKAVGFAKADAINKLDSTWADYISSFQSFNDSFPGSVYIPELLPSLFPALKEGSVAIISYNYLNDMPEDFSMYSDPTDYVLVADDYTDAGAYGYLTGYFYPDFNPDFYLPEVLLNALPDAEAGDIYKVAYKYADVNPVIEITTSFEENFDIDLGKFDTTSIIGTQGWYRTTFNADTYAKMAGFTGGTAYVNEDWLISNPIVLGNDDNITLNFTHAIRYLNDRWDQISVAISKDYDGSNIAGATWDVIDWADVADTALLGFSYDKYSSGDIDLSSYKNETIFVAFKYTSDLTNQPTWQIYDVTVTPIKPVASVVYQKAPKTYNDMYEYNGSAWDKLENVFYLSGEDYNALNVSNNRFSATVNPQDYIPTYLNAKYSYPIVNGTSAIVVYDFYINSDFGTTVVSDEYTYKAGEWVSSFNFISTATEQFIYSETGWLFDPTVKFTMLASDYDIIVDAVLADNPTYGYTDGSREFYYGAASKYTNFDLRVSKKAEFGIPGYDGLTEAEAIDKTWEMIPEAINLLLTLKYPDAVADVSGVDVHYIVTFYTYENDLTSFYYSIDFQCTKSGPDPEFTQNIDHRDDADKDKVYYKYGMKKVQ